MGGLKTLPWEEKVITSGPDVMFEIDSIPGYDNSLIIFAAEFFNKRLTVYQVEKGSGKLLNSRVIDGNID